MSYKIIFIAALLCFSVFFSHAQWALTGNSGTSTSTNFIGTTDNNGLLFKTNNIERLSLSGTGNALFKTPLTSNLNEPVFTINGGITSIGASVDLFDQKSSGEFTFRSLYGTPILYYTSNGVLSSGSGIDVNFYNSGQVTAKTLSAIKLRGATWFQTEINVDRPTIEYKAFGAQYMATGESAHNFTVGSPLTISGTNIASFNNGGASLMLLTREGILGIGTTTPSADAKLDVAGNIFSSGKIAIGTNDMAKIGTYSLAVNGDAIFNKATVKLYGNWPDYVFNSEYKLLSLQEVELFIQKNKHLPDVPSAAEIEKTGINIGDNQAILLKKIEEMTLYMIEINKRLETLTTENKELKTKVDNLTSNK